VCIALLIRTSVQMEVNRLLHAPAILLSNKMVLFEKEVEWALEFVWVL